jgi:hypothetical protein
MVVITPAIGRDHNVPAEDASVRLMPIEDPVPSHVQVRVKDSAPRDQSENRRGIACEYPAASSSSASLLTELSGESSDMAAGNGGTSTKSSVPNR